MSLPVPQSSPYPTRRSSPQSGWLHVAQPAPPVPSWAPLRGVRPISTRPLVEAPGQRVGDAERSLVCEQLSLHYSEGRLDPEELEERLSAAMGARTRGDLASLTRDLPAAPARSAAVPTPAPRTAARVAALLVLLATSGICLLMIMASVLVSPGWAIGAVFGGSFAAVGGIAIGYLWSTRRWSQDLSRR